MKHLLSLERLDVGRTLALTVGSPSAHRRGTMLKHYAFMLLFLIAGIGQAWGTDPVSTLNFSAKCNGSGTADDEMTWTITSDGTESNFDSEKGIHYGTNNAAVTNIVLTSASFGDNKTITKVVVEASGNNSPSLSVTVGGIAFGETKTGITTTNTSYTFEPTEAQSENDYKGAVVVTLAKSSSAKKAIYVKSVAVTYTSGGSQEPTVSLTSLALNPASVWLAKGGSVTLSPVYTPDNATNKNVTWSSSNTSVANVTSAGVVTASSTNTGTATITCTSAQSSSIKATCTVTVANGDVLTQSNIGTNDSYSSWTNKKGSGNVAIYAGYSYGKDKIQIKAGDNSGIVSTTSAGKIKNVSVTWNASNTAERTIDIYGNNTAYTSTEALYSNTASVKGTKIGSITYPATTCTLSSGDYEYVGVRSNSGTAYLNSVTFFWEAIPTHTLTYGMAEGCGSMGSLSATVGGNTVTSGSQVNEGASVTLVPTINSGYEFVSYAATAGSTITNNVFTMPASDETITLTLQAIPLTALTLNESSLDLAVNEEVQLSVTSVTPSGALTTVNWSTSDGSVATVVDGLVKAKGDGTATITATSTITGTVKATCTVTVTTPEGIAEPTLTLADNVSHNAGSVVKVSNHNEEYIYAYTLDGTTTPALDGNLDPVDNVFIYDHTNGITLSATCTLKIVAYDIDGNHSDVVTKNYTINPAATVKLYENTQLKTTLSENLFVGSQIATRPNPVSSTLGGKTFVGWCASTADPTNLIVFPYTITGTETVWHAVYATLGDPTFTKLSSNSFDSQKTYVLGAEQAANNSTLWFKSTSYTVDANDSWGNAVQASASNIAFFTLSGTAAELVAQDATGNYIAPTTDSKFRMSSESSTLALQSDGTIRAQVNQTTFYAYYNYNNGSGGFRFYNQTKNLQPAYFYEYTSGSISGHITSVTSHAITVAECTNGCVTADESSAPVSTTITITATPSAGYALLSFDVYKTGESSTKVDFTVDPDNYKQATFSMPAYAVTVSATFIKVGTAENPLTVAELIASQANLDGYYVYAQGIVSQLGSFNSTNGYYTYYFSADGTTTSQFEVYNGYKGSHQEGDEWYYDGFSAASDLALGDEVIVEGYIKYFNNTKYQFEAQNSELTSYCRPVVVTKGAETASEGTYTLTSGGNALSAKYCLADLSGENDLTVTVTASPQPGYRLKSIISLDGETVVGTVGAISNNTCTITGIKASTTITANFEQVFAVSLAINANGTLHGDCSATINEVAGPVSVAAGETINLAASVASEDDEFVNWTATEGITITSATALSTTATATQAGTITANFRPLADPHTITNGGVIPAYGTIAMTDMEDNVVTSLNLRPDKTGKLVATETDGYRFTGWTVTPANAVTFADATSMETTFTAKDVDASISANYEARTLYTVKFMNGNTQIGTDATVYDGRTIDLLGAQTSFDANHTRFCGWVKNSFEGIADAEPSFVSGAQTIDGNTTFYAVYGNANETNNYGKITEAAELESGKNYLIVAEYNSGLEALHAAELSKEYWLKTGVVTADNNVIASTVAERTWQISVNAGVAHVYNAENEKYLGVNYVSNGGHYNARIYDDAYNLTIALNDGAWNISGVSNTKTVYVIHAPGYSEYIGSNAAAPVYLYKQLYESDEWVSLPVEYVSVTFDKHAGSETVTNMPANITGQMKGYSLTEPSETPERAGYNFIGWNTDNEATEPMSFPQTINTNTTVYAIWQAYPDCAIDLYVNGVKDDDISTSVKQGAELDLSAIDAPERLGYDFLGWAANPRAEENTTAIDIVEAYTPTPNLDTQKSFYAVYTRQEGVARYEKVTTDLETAWAGDYLIAYDAETFADGRTGGESGIGASGVSVNPGEYLSNNVVAASWGNTYKVTLEEIATNSNTYLLKTKDGNYNYKTDNNNGITTNTNRATADDYPLTIAFISASDISIANASGAVFHYNTSSNGYFRFYKDGGQNAVSLYKYVAPTTYYTTNPAVNYNVSYNLAGGAWKEDEGCESAIVAANESYDVCADVPVKTDYIFDGWTVGGESVGASITVTGTTVIVANYRTANTYNVSYDANGALGTAPAVTPVKEGASHTVLGNTWFFKAGYSFTGWNTAADGNGTAYAKDAIMTMPSENVTLYAQWSNSISERDVVIVAHYGDKYYAMGQTLSSGQLNAVQVQMLNGKVRDVAEENRAAITWHMIVNANNSVSFYSPVNEKYLGAGSSTNLALSEEAVEWTWDNEKKCYKIGETAKSFWYRNTESGKDPDYYNFFKYYSTANVGVNGYASEMILAYGFAVTIDGDATESAITVGDDVVVTEDAELTINNERVLNSLTVEAGGQVSGGSTLTVNNLTINSEAGKSGQVTGSNVSVNGDIYLDIKLLDGTGYMSPEQSQQWYCISAPFDIAFNGGFFWGDGTSMGYNVDFQAFVFDGEKRANTGVSGWQRVSGKMEAGRAYLIGFDDERTNQKTIRLKAMTNTIPTASKLPTEGHTAADEANKNWNGVGNPTLHYIALDGFTAKVQCYDNNSHGYSPYDPATHNYVVGTALFMQATGNINLTDPDNGSFRAPQRMNEENEKYSFCVEIAKEGASRCDNRLYVSTSDEATSSYEQGKDMLSMNGTSSKFGALIWTKNYGMRLASEDVPMVNDKATYTLGIYAPQDGKYSISATEATEDATLYLTKDGRVIWNLSMSACEVELTKGTTEGYGLLLVRKAPGVATGNLTPTLSQGEGAKILIDEHVYILRGGQMYDVTGKAVK